MSWDLSFDAVTGDLIRDGAGWKINETEDTAVLNQLSIQYDRWWADPTLGCLLFDRDRFTSAPAALVAAEVERALNVLAIDGIIANLQVIAEESTKAGRVNVRTLYRVVATGQNVEQLLPVGG